MSFTITDRENAAKYATERHKWRIVKILLNKYPHIFTHSKVKLIPADPDKHFYYPKSLQKKAIILDFKITKKMCEKLACNPAKFEDTCKPTESASVYRIGDDGQWGIQCQASCFNLLKKTNNNKVHMVDLEWNDNTDSCIIIPMSKVWSEKPLYRSKERYEIRVNTLPLGFNKGKTTSTTSGTEYKMNLSYCMAFFQKFEDGHCEKEGYRKYFLDYVIGESIVNFIKSAESLTSNTSDFPDGTIPRRDDMPDIPGNEKADPYQFDNWIKDIDTSFELPPLEGNIEIEEQKKFYSIKSKTKADEKKIDGKATLEKITDILGGLLQMIFTAEFWRDLSIQLGIEISIKTSVNLLAKFFFNWFVPNLADFLARTGFQITSHILKDSIEIATMKAFGNVVAESVGALGGSILKLLAEVGSVIGVVLLVTSVLDIALTIWDPLNFNKMVNTDIIQQVSRSSELALKQQLKTNKIDMTLELLSGLLLEKKENNNLMLIYTIDVIEYLSALEVNSDGTVIEKGDLLTFDKDISNNIDQNLITNKKNYIYDYKLYETDHVNRLKTLRITKITIILSVIASLITLIFQLYIAALIFFIITSIITFIHLYTISNNYFIQYLQSYY